MQLTFPCPNCGKEYDLPWSMAGKKARCKRCSKDFVIPAPFEPTGPRSSEAIPVAKTLQTPPSGPREIRAQDPPPPELLAKLRSGSKPRPASDEPPPPPDPRQARSARAEPPARPEPASKESGEANDPPWPHHARSRNRGDVLARGALAPKPPEPEPIAKGRPPWLIPSIVGGGVALIVAINVGFYVSMMGAGRAGDEAEQTSAIEPNPAGLANLGGIAGAPTDPAPAEATPSPSPKPAAPAPKATTKKPTPPRQPAVVAQPPEEIDPNRVMNTAEIVSRYEPSVALIQGKKKMGTGFVARAGIVATNSHVIDGERTKDIEVRFPSAPETKRGPYTAKLLYQDKDRDLALLGVATDLPPVRVAENYKFRKGEDVTVIGNPGVGGQLVLENAISRGIVSSMAKLDDHSFLQLGIAINPGNSGGPVFDPKGRVIGVVTLKTSKQEGLAFAVPAEDLLSALDTAESVASRDPGDGSSPNPSGAPALTYAFKQGESYVYSVEVTIDTGNVRVILVGNSLYRVKSVDSEGMTFLHKGWLTTIRKGKDGKVLPNGITGPDQTKEVEVKIDDKGNVVSASGTSPLSLLGDFAMLMIEPFPDDPTPSWDDSQTIALREVEQEPGAPAVGPRLGRPGLDNRPQSRLGARSRLNSRGHQAAPSQPQPQLKVTIHEASEETKYTLGKIEGARAPIRKQYELTTKELVGNEPRLQITGDGTLSFDVKAGIPVALAYQLRVVEASGNVTIRVPISVACKLLEGKDREKALKPPSMPPTAMNKVTNGEVTKLIADLKSGDNNKRREALRAFYDSAPLESRRGEVARAIDRAAGDKDNGVRSDSVKALGVWGDGKSLDALIASLGDPNYGVRDELFEAIARLAPNEKGAEAIIPYLSKEQGRALKALKGIGTAAEGPLLKVAEEGGDTKLRQEACRALKEMGTTQSLPALQRIAELKIGGEVARQAPESIKEINRRYPNDDEWRKLIRQLRVPEARLRREGAERLEKCKVEESRKPEAARALDALVAEEDRFMQGAALRAMRFWGDAGTRDVLIRWLEDPKLWPYREVLEVLVALGPDERAALAIARASKKDRRLALEALGKMGPVAEPAVIEMIRNAGDDGFLRKDACKLLSKIGHSQEAVDALREASKGPSNRENVDSVRRLQDRLDGRAEFVDPADLTGSDGGKRRAALEQLLALPPGSKLEDRDQVARALDATWKINDVFIKGMLREAVIAWGDAKSVDALVEFLSTPDPKQWEEALLALVKLRPDARTAELLASRFAKDPRRVTEYGQQMPAQFEVQLQAFARDGDPKLRLEACRALGQVGTPSSIPTLQTLAARAGDDEVARDAEDAMKTITARN